MGFFAKRREEKVWAARQAQLTEFRRLRDAEVAHTAVAEHLAARNAALAALGEGNPYTRDIRLLYARALADAGHCEEALLEFRAIADAAGRDPEGRMTWAVAVPNLTAQLCFLERYEEAETTARQAIVEVQKLPAIRHPFYAKVSATNSLARALIGLDRPLEAEQIAREALAEAAANTHLPSGNVRRILSVNLAAALNAQRRHAEALVVLDEATMIEDATAQHSDASAIAMVRAAAVLGLGRPAEAALTAKAGLEQALLAFGSQHPRCRTLRKLLAEAEGRAPQGLAGQQG